MRTQTHGVEVTIIDFTLSRLTAASGQVHSCDLSADPALFQGRRGDCQVCMTPNVKVETWHSKPAHRLSPTSLQCLRSMQLYFAYIGIVCPKEHINTAPLATVL